MLIPLVCSKKVQNSERGGNPRSPVRGAHPSPRGKNGVVCGIDHTTPSNVTLLGTERGGLSPRCYWREEANGVVYKLHATPLSLQGSRCRGRFNGTACRIHADPVDTSQTRGGEMPPCTAPPLLLASLPSRWLRRPKFRAWAVTWPA